MSLVYDTCALQHYLGHKNIMHTVRFTELSPERFRNFWEDWRREPKTEALRSLHTAIAVAARVYVAVLRRGGRHGNVSHGRVLPAWHVAHAAVMRSGERALDLE